MFMYRNNEESKSFEVFFFFFGGVGKRHPLFSSLFSVIRNPKTIKNPENCRRCWIFAIFEPVKISSKENRREKKNVESFRPVLKLTKYDTLNYKIPLKY